MIRSSTIGGVTLAIGFWFLESLIHSFAFMEDEINFIPSDINELWMRLVICGLIILFGIYSDYQNRKLLAKEQEKLSVFKATVRSSQQILNNHLNQMQLFMLKAKSAGLIDPELESLYNESLAESGELLKSLSMVDNPTEEKIEESVQPWLKDDDAT